MAEDYLKFLAGTVMNEEKNVTYRSLSYALAVHNNVAKRMLFDFHVVQNRKQPGSVRATYLILGFKRSATPGRGSNENDGHLQSSPYKSSPVLPVGQSEPSTKRVLTLVKEEDLDEARAIYDTITSFHVYSLGPSQLQNIQLLSDVTHEIFSTNTGNDPVDPGLIGTIRCGSAQRRARTIGTFSLSRHNDASPRNQGATCLFSTFSGGAASKSQESQVHRADATIGSESKLEINPGRGSQRQSPKLPNNKIDKNSLVTAFAKSKHKSSAAKKTAPDKRAVTHEGDTIMRLSSEEDSDRQEDNTLPWPKAGSEASRSDKKAREERLHQMMEEDDTHMSDGISVRSNPTSLDEINSKEDADTKSVGDISLPPAQSGGRGRGKRRIVKKITTKDAEGFLVTREEPAWESFSEEELAPSLKSNASALHSKAKKGGGKTSGNIMSFFSKK